MEGSILPLSWARDALRLSEAGGPVPDDPGKDPRFQKLVEAVLLSRKIVGTYNLALLVILAVIAVRHWNEERVNKKTVWEIEQVGANGSGNVEEAWSSSSSTIEGTATPPDVQKKIQDGESQPLLRDLNSRRRRSRWKLYHWIRGWLQHQPAPIPIIDKALPPNNVSIFVLLFLALNFFYNFYRLPLSLPYLFVFADRCGLLFVANLPLLYLLAAKTQPLKLLTGHSYESLNILHRRVGELLCFEAALHFLGMIGVWYTLLSRVGFTFTRFLSSNLVLLGIGAFVAYQVLFITSLRSFRNYCYEIFLALHIFLQAAGLAFVWLHYRTGRPYVAIALIIFILDRLFFRLRLKSSTHTATLTLLPDDQTVLMSTNWDIAPHKPLPFPFSLIPVSTDSGWKPTDHIFLTVPAISRYESHPFTIFSAAPVLPSPSSSSLLEPSHAWLSLLIRAHSGFTKKLLTHTLSHPQTTIHLSGPYGSSHALSTLKSSSTAIIVAGGSGIAVAYPLLWALLSPTHSPTPSHSSRRQVKLLWVTHSTSHLSWLPSHQLKELVEWGLDLRLWGPTSEIGRPDVSSILEEWVDEGVTTGIVVSGPEGLVRDVRNVGAKTLRRGADVRVVVEKFGW